MVLFLVAIVPVITDQVRSITDQAPHWFDRLQNNETVQDLDDEYDVIDKARDYVTGGDFVGTLFGGALGIGLAVLGALFNAFIILVLTLYFLSSLDDHQDRPLPAGPGLAPRPGQPARQPDHRERRRLRLGRLHRRDVRRASRRVVFLFAVGLGKYAVALAFVVAVLDVIPMIGATIGAVVVTAIAFAEDPKIGIACVIFYVIYQQVENYVIYPRVMSKSVDVPGAVTVIAALVGAALLGVVGALLAIPTAAAILMLTREVFVRRQDQR